MQEIVSKMPEELEDDQLGLFTYDESLECFVGEVEWQGAFVETLLGARPEQPADAQKVWQIIHDLVNRQGELDAQWRAFAAEQLQGDANGSWKLPDAPLITENQLAAALEISGLDVGPLGRYTAYYGAEGIFGDHSILVEGSLIDGVKIASIAG